MGMGGGSADGEHHRIWAAVQIPPLREIERHVATMGLFSM